MGKGNILFVLIFALALIFARYKRSSSAAQQPQPQTKPPAQKIIQKEPEKKQTRVIRMKVTAYCPCQICCGKCSDGLTSSGKNAWRTDGAAADPNMLPYFSELVIPGVGIRFVDDTGGAMRKSAKKGICHIDLRFRIPDGVEKTPEEMKKCHQRAKEFGVRWLDVTVLNVPQRR